MKIALYRLNYKVRCGFLVSFIFAVLFAVLPNYEAIQYSKTKAEDDAQDYVGYPAGDDVPVLETLEEITAEKNVFTIEVDVEDIQPLGVYHGLTNNAVTSSAARRFLLGIGNDSDTAMGQFYSVNLNNGDMVIVFLDDYVVKLPHSGEVRLPRGEVKLLGDGSKKHISAKAGISKKDLKYYVNMVGSWRDSSIAENGKTMRIWVVAIVFLTVFPLVYFVLWGLERKFRKATDSENEAEVEKITKEIPQTISAGNGVSKWYKIDERKKEGYKLTRKESVEACLDKASGKFAPGYDWRQDRRRSFGMFGITLAAVGAMLVGLPILICISQKVFHIVPLVLCIMGILFMFIGIRVARWDLPEKARMTSVDRGITYRYLLCLQDQTEELKDFNRLEEIIKAFYQRFEPWTLKIEPPIGSLTEWKCYYNEQAGYVTEITLDKKNMVQRWKRSSHKTSPNDIKQLKKIIIERKKVKL